MGENIETSTSTEPSPLQDLETICGEIYARWDKDMRSGKLLGALAGTCPGYRDDVEKVRRALAAQPDLLEAAKMLLGHSGVGMRFSARQKFAEAAIAKAEGRA